MNIKHVMGAVLFLLGLGVLTLVSSNPKPQASFDDLGFSTTEQHGNVTMHRGSDLEATPEQRELAYEKASSQENYMWVNGTAMGVEKILDPQELQKDVIMVEYLLLSTGKDNIDPNTLFTHVTDMMTPLVPGPDGEVKVEFPVYMAEATQDSLVTVLTQDPDKGTELRPIIWLPIYPSEGKFSPVLLTIAPDDRGFKKDLYIVTIFRFAELDGGEEEYSKFVGDLSSDLLEKKALGDATTRQT